MFLHSYGGEKACKITISNQDFNYFETVVFNVFQTEETYVKLHLLLSHLLASVYSGVLSPIGVEPDNFRPLKINLSHSNC